jgi:hypothetical protein
MRIRVNWMLIVAAIFVSIFTVTGGSAQVELASGAPQQRVFLSKLSPPIYPPLARVARVAGDVDLSAEHPAERKYRIGTGGERSPVVETSCARQCYEVRL